MKIDKLESIRGFVAVYIVFHHIVSYYRLYEHHRVLKIFFMHPQEAVLVFFLLSGFVIYISTARSSNLSYYGYLKKRLLRIYPITIIAFLISTLVFFINGGHWSSSYFKDLAGNLLMLQDDKAQPGLIVPTYLNNVPLWSLSYEWWFYMLFFPLFIYFRRPDANSNFSKVYLILGISASGWGLFLLFPGHLFLVTTYFLIWWTGVDCAEIYLKHNGFRLKNLLPVIISVSVMSLLIGIPVLSAFSKQETLSQINQDYPISTYLHYYLDVLLFIAMGWAWWRLRLFGFNFLLKPFKIFAPVSFAIYIVHFPFILLELPFIKNFYLQILAKLALILITAYLLEIKMQPLANKLFNNKITPRKKELETQAF